MATPLATEVQETKRKMRTLREQMSVLAEAQERDSRKLDELQEKLAQVIKILSQIGPHMEKLPEPPASRKEL